MTPPVWLFWESESVAPDLGVSATGGTITDAGGYRYHTFTSGGTLDVTTGGNVEVLLVGGGGAGNGNSNAGGGGGAGGVRLLDGANSLTLSVGSYAITVGDGGVSGFSNTSGQASSIIGPNVSETALGGGRGGDGKAAGASGGSGGGGGAQSNSTTNTSGGSGTSGQGNNGGNAYTDSPYISWANDAAAGGGGAGAAGGNAVYRVGGNGGDGVTVWGSSYGGGGGGGVRVSTATPGTGGLGGGGNGGANSIGTAGLANTGGGGGGGNSLNITGGAGGSGIVIVRYPVTVWQPTNFSDLQCWLDASDSTTLFDALTGGSLPGDNGSIGRWEDKSGNGYHADDARDVSAQKTSTTRPTRVIAAQNGLDAINFASQGFDHYLSSTMLKNRSSALVAHVSKYNGTTGGSWIWSHEEYGDFKKRFQFGRFSLASQRLDSNDAAVRVYGTSDGTSSGTSDTDWHVHIGVLDWASGTMEYFIDGESKGSASYTSGSGNTANTNINANTNYHRAVIGITQSASATFSKVPDGTRIGELICVAQSSGSYTLEDREKLEGYLAHKWGLEGNLPPDHPYKNAAPTVSTWTPSNIAGLSGWYRADSLTGLNDGDPVSAWGDDSGLNRDMTEGSATLPTYKVGIQNSLPVVDFAGANFIGTPTASKSEWSFMHQQGTTVFVVYQTREDTRYGIIGTSGFSGNQRGYLLAANFANQGSILNYIAAGSGGTLLTPVQNISTFYVATPDVTNLLVATCDPTKAVASERSTHHINGTFRGSNNVRTDSVVPGDPYLPLRMGLNGPSSNMLYLNGFIAEVIIYDSELSNDDRQTVEGYLAHKWGITANLPVDHPYKNEAP